MRYLKRSVQAAAATLFLSLSASPALAQNFERYVSVFGGVNYPNDSDLRVELTPPMAILGTMYYQSGGIGGISVGRQWSNGFAVEGELAFWRDRFDYESLDGVTDRLEIDGGIDTYTLMFNGIRHFESNSVFTPYIGAGAGIALMSVSALAETDTDRFRDDDTGFAYQAIAGVSFRMGEQTDIALEYRRTGTSKASFTDDPSGSGSVTSTLERGSDAIALRLIYSF